ncbi:MAG: hypothetical protein IPL92_04840 [Saprospiraceae bacterium]|nr:hypothetical protein [Candidatus Opimibacter iunctus]
MQGGTWDNQGGGANRARYDGRLIWGANSKGDWTADGTANSSNLPPALDPCYFQAMSSGSGANTAYIRFAGDISAGDHFEWMERVQYVPDWNAFMTCTDYNSWPNNYIGQVFSLTDEFSIGCWVCNGCNPHEDALILSLPWDGLYNVKYTDGTDTFEVLGVSGINGVGVTVTHDITYSLVSVEKVGGCTVYSKFSGPVTLTAPYRDPGLHHTFYVCPNEGYFALSYFLEGTPEDGGVWYPPLSPMGFYYSTWGPGTYVYTQEYQPPHSCPPDTASVTIYWTDISASDVEVSCDVNGTPHDITDDRIVINLTVNGEGFGPDYYVEAFVGDVTPTDGVVGVQQTFTLDPGTATASYMTLHVVSYNPLWCDFWLPIEPPGFCSDPCDPDMFATISGPDDLCVKNCIIEPGTMMIDISGGTPGYQMDFTLTAPNNSPWVFPLAGVPASGEISICVDNVPAPVYNGATGQLIIPQSLADSEITFTLDNLYDFYGCISALGNAEHTFFIHPQPTVTTFSLMLCLDDAKDIDLTEYDVQINPFYEVTWYDGDPLQGGEEINSPTGANLVNVVQLWALVTDDYCVNSIQVPFTIFPLPDLDSVPPVRICQGDVVVLSAIPLVDAGNSGATYSYHSSLPPDSTNLLDPLYFVPTDSTTIYVLASAAICYDTLAIQIFVEDYPDFTLEGQPCDLLQGTYSVLFTSSADSIYASVGVVVNNASGQDAVTGIPNNTNVTIELFNPTALCSDTFLIVAPNCNCPQLNQPVPGAAGYSLCEDETSPVMSVTVDPGLVANWYTVPSGGVAFLQNSLTYQPVTPANATYYVEALDPGSNCYSLRTSIGLQVYPLPILQSPADPVLCAGETLNLTAMTPAELNGVPGSGGWFKLPGNLPASGTVVPVNGDTWQYVYTSASGNCEDRDTITAIVNPLPAVLVYDILCDDQALTYELLFTSNADVITMSGGTLVQIAGTDSFALEDIPFDTDIQFDLEITATGCTQTILLPAPDCSCPALLSSAVYQLCSEPGTVDMATFEGPGVNGTWQMVSTPPGANPATLSGSNFDGFPGGCRIIYYAIYPISDPV